MQGIARRDVKRRASLLFLDRLLLLSLSLYIYIYICCDVIYIYMVVAAALASSLASFDLT